MATFDPGIISRRPEDVLALAKFFGQAMWEIVGYLESFFSEDGQKRLLIRACEARAIKPGADHSLDKRGACIIGAVTSATHAEVILAIDRNSLAAIDEAFWRKFADLAVERKSTLTNSPFLGLIFGNLFRWLCPEEMSWEGVDRSRAKFSLSRGAMLITFQLELGEFRDSLEVLIPSELLFKTHSSPYAYSSFFRNPRQQVVAVPSELIDSIIRTLNTLLDNFTEKLENIWPDGRIGRDLTEEDLKNLSFDERLAALDRHAVTNPNIPVSQYIFRFLPEALSTISSGKDEVLVLPKKAPERWPTNAAKRTENPAEFAVRVYRPWMSAGLLTRTALKRLDQTLFASLDNWLKHNRRKRLPDPLPEGFRLLTVEDANDRWVERVRSGEEPLPDDPGEVARFAAAEAYRKRGLSDGASLSPPDHAPQLWTKDRQSGESPPDFIRRHYAPWLGRGLTRPMIGRLDKPLYLAFAKWIERHGMPNDLDLPTITEANERLVEQLESTGKNPMDVAASGRREGERLRGILRRREGKEKGRQ